MLEPASTPDPREAGLWLRLAAALLDGLVLVVALQLLVLLGVLSPGLRLGTLLDRMPSLVFAGWLVFLHWLYCAPLESSSLRATPGKRVLKLQVVGLDGGRISLARATGRHLAKLLSALPLLAGFLLVAVPPRKQGLHDRLAATRVIRRGPGGLVAATAIITLAVAVMGLTVGVAVPAYLASQRGKKVAEAYSLLGGLADAERAALQLTGAYVPIEAPAGGPPVREPRAWSAAELRAAADLGWSVLPRTHFSYRLVAERAPWGDWAFAACAESDLDGDGVVQAIAYFEPAEDAAGHSWAPAAPCAHATRLDRPLAYHEDDGRGVRKLTPRGVY